jgi:glutathione peroxidase
LQSELESIKAAGLRPVGLSYDKVEVLKKFGSKEGIQFPLLADPDSKVIRKLGIANTSAKQGSKKYNIAHPMTIVINSDSTVAGVIPGTVRERHRSNHLVEAWAKMSKSDESESTESAPKSALAFEVKNIEGEDVELEKYKGKVVVMVNVASKCGLTPQYESLQKLYADHKDDGLVVLGFPCNQFGKQEPGSEEEIQAFCQKNYGVEFDMFSKINVNGDKATPLYKYLTAQETKPAGSGAVKWNFEKFVIGRDGNIAGRFGPRVKPDSDEFKEFLAEQLEYEAK